MVVTVLRVVPLEVTRLPVVEVYSFRIGILSGAEGSAIVVKLVREAQLEF